jgi:hypothetical protein
MGVAHFHRNGRDLSTVYADGSQTGEQGQLRRRLGRLSSHRQNDRTLFHTSRFNRARNVNNAPVQMRITRQRFDPGTYTIDEEFHAVKI